MARPSPAIAAASVAAVVNERAKSGAAGALAGRRAQGAGDGGPSAYVFNNGAVGVEVLRDGRSAAFVMGAERGGGPIDLFRRPLDPIQARGHFFYVSEEGERAMVDRLRAGAARGRLSARGARVQSSGDRQCVGWN